MTCPKCAKSFNAGFASCGTGYSWYLYCCPHCGQLIAQAKADGYIPEGVEADPEVICIEPAADVRFKFT